VRKGKLDHAFQRLCQELRAEERRAKAEMADKDTRVLGKIRMSLVQDRLKALWLIKVRHGRYYKHVNPPEES
jgi:hypothetical protein